GNRDDRRGGHDAAPVVGVLAEERLQADRDRVLVLRPAEHRHREDELVPGGDEAEHARRDEPWHDEGKQHGAEHPPPARAVDVGRLLELHRDGLDEASQHPDPEGERERDVHDHESEDAVEQAQALDLQEQRDHERLERHHLDDEDHQQDRGAELETEARHGDGGEEAHQRAHQHGHERDDEGVAQEGAEAALREHEGEVVERRLLGKQRLAAAGRLLVEGAGEHPVHREEGEEQDGGDADAESDAGQDAIAGFHSSSSFMRARTYTTVIASSTSVRSTARAEPNP
ncbi:hypothetical protein ABE10_02695, partial [Bacillus toyonensis]|nr:hypothetical protein [Bacillus toyonensis]